MGTNVWHSSGAVYDLLKRLTLSRVVIAVLLAIHTPLLGYNTYAHSPTLNEPGHLASGHVRFLILAKPLAAHLRLSHRDAVQTRTANEYWLVSRGLTFPPDAGEWLKSDRLLALLRAALQPIAVFAIPVALRESRKRSATQWRPRIR